MQNFILEEIGFGEFCGHVGCGMTMSWTSLHGRMENGLENIETRGKGAFLPVQ